MTPARAAAAAALMCATLGLAPRAARAANLVVSSTDGPGEGFNDPTPFVPVGGNTATTLGAARLQALQFAAGLWGAKLVSPVDIVVSASFDALVCTSSSAELGNTGPTTVHRDFPAAPRGGVWYAQAPANALARTDLDPSLPDMVAAFNGTLDGGSCLGGQRWYYGLDGNPPSGRLDFVTTASHELAHGLGFLTFVDLETGAKLLGYDDAFMVQLERHGTSPSGYPQMTDAQRVAASVSGTQLQWLGGTLDGVATSLLTAGTSAGHVLMYAPSTQAPGSSVSHFSTTVTPNELMEPFFTGTNHDLTLTTKLLQDAGWQAAAAFVPGAPPAALALLGAALGGAAVSRLRPRRRRR